MNRINLIALGVRNIADSLAFYKAIGFQASVVGTDEEPVIVFFKNQGSKLELFPLELLAKDINEENPPTVTDGKSFPGFTLAYNAKSVEEVDDIFKRLIETGAEIAKNPRETSWGGYGGYFKDIDGYYWEVAYGPDWEFDETDMLVIN
ncbi:VOC family protein [Niallia taxi]|mgnify:CR=1 FL=1|uniref:VOC family protein n=1 Tax=Niallia taxi TaxID=2499688 RepID=UPI0021A27DE7|nr:VOC family protein [Niallia taxi]MCT2345969.1 VOC family protein [Niallia taxi]MDE5053642.1 VOC family protein [Niallia taxi]MED3964327.1 VOC family protein [Niallia taxi]WOD63295.1 VOC family protein [Niallia taxi]